MKQTRRYYKWELIILFWAAYFLNQGDRQIYGAVLPLIKTNLGVGDAQLGMVVTIFTAVYGVLVPLAGCLGDFISRKWIVCLSLLIFSTGTLLTGFSGGLITLILFRSIATGAGEAFYYPAANSLIAQHHHNTRAQAMAIHQTSLYFGIVASSWLAGYIGELHGWRASFYTFGFGGIALSVVLAWRLQNDRKDGRDCRDNRDDDDREDRESRMPAPCGSRQPSAACPAPPVASLSEALGVILRKPTFYLLSLAFGGMVFVNVGFMTWAPTYLYEKFPLSLKEAALHSMLYHYAFAFVGVMAGGYVSDRLARQRPRIRLEIECLGLLLGAPFIYLMGACPGMMMVFAAFAGFGLFRGLYDSNLFAALFEVIPPRYRSSATGLMLSFAFIVGAAAPVILGAMKKSVNLGRGLSLLAFVYLFSSGVIFLALRFFFAKDFHREESHEHS